MNEVKIGDVKITWLGHASFLIEGNKRIYIDPHVLPKANEKADVVLITHEHFDHANMINIRKLCGEWTKVFGPEDVIRRLGFGTAISRNEKVELGGVTVTAVSAYNVNKFRSPGQLFHPPGLGFGYVIEMNNKRIYHAGDTDRITEMNSLKNIDVALLPIGGMYTMTLQEATEAALMIKPKILVPMHYNSDKYGIAGIYADPRGLVKLLAKEGITVNILEPYVK